MSLLKQYLGEHKKAIIIELTIKFLGTITDLLIPMILAVIIDDIAPQGSIPLLIRWGLLMLFVAFITMVLNMMANMQSAKIAKDIVQKLRKDLFYKTIYLSAKQVDKITISSLDTRVTSDTYNLQQVIGMMLRIGIRAPIILIGGILISFSLDWVLTLIMVAILPIMIIIIWFISSRGIKLFRDVQKREDGLVSRVRENVSGIRVIKALSSGEYEREKFDEVNRELKKSDMKAVANMTLSNPLISLFLNMATVVVIYVGAYRVANGLCEVGTLLAFATYFTVILGALMAVSRIFIMSTRAAASAGRIQEVFDCENDLMVQEKSVIENEAHIAFDQVSFSYHGKTDVEDVMNLTDINFSLKKGETLGIIGPTGSGKTTLLMLLMRFYDVTKGRISINGRDIKSIDTEKLHDMFGIVQQNDFLFSDTIRENIAFGRKLSDEQIEQAIEIAQANKFIDHLDDGFEHKLTIKGSNLSGGQKQRLLIARAVASQPDILILDDSSSALDYKTDLLLRQELNKQCVETTTIIVAQRISSIREANQILVLDEGKVLGQGSHDELMKTCDWYKALSEQQMGLG